MNQQWMTGLLLGWTVFVAVMVCRALIEYRKDRRNARRRTRTYSEIARRIEQDHRAWGVSDKAPLEDRLAGRARPSMFERPVRAAREHGAVYRRRPSWVFALVFVVMLLTATWVAVALSK